VTLPKAGATAAAQVQVAAAPPKGLTPELLARRQEIHERVATLEQQDYFVLLGVARDATSAQVQAAFFAAAKRWHPDRLPPALASEKDACSKVFARIGDANQTLADPEKRKRYIQQLAECGPTMDEQAKVATILEAAQEFQKAEMCLKRGDTGQAELLARKALKLDTRPEYVAAVAWCEAQRPENLNPKATQRAIDMLDRALSESERLERAYFYRGMLHKRLNNGPLALRDFKRAAELNPRNVDAVREVRLFEMRRAKG
jgi:tetratricopeptide (TPR) repeat protein